MWHQEKQNQLQEEPIREMGKGWKVAAVIGLTAIIAREMNKQFGWDKDAALQLFVEWSNRLGVWAMPVYVGIHTITLAFCLPYAVFFEAGASLLFGFLPAVLCVFSAKLLGASLSFWIGRYFKMSSFVYSFLLGLFPDRIFLQFYQLDPIVYSLVSFVLGKY